MQVYKEDITKHACGAIVNAANCKLLHSGGVAAYLSTAAGSQFQAMCSAKAAALPRGTVEVGNCLVTDAGELPCTKVIHAVGPNFAGQKQSSLFTTAATGYWCCCRFVLERCLWSKFCLIALVLLFCFPSLLAGTSVALCRAKVWAYVRSWATGEYSAKSKASSASRQCLL